MGEYGINALYLGALGVPVGMVAGDDALAEEVGEWLPWAERVVVKRGVSRQAADSVHPSVARELILAASRRAVERAGNGELEPLVLPRTHQASPSTSTTRGQADFAAVIPGFVRVGDRGVRYEADRRHRGISRVRGGGPHRGSRERVAPDPVAYWVSTTARRSARSAMRDIGSPTTSSRIDQTCGGESSAR